MSLFGFLDRDRERHIVKPGMSARDFLAAIRDNPEVEVFSALAELFDERPRIVDEFLDAFLSVEDPDDKNVAGMCFAALLTDERLPAEKREKNARLVEPAVRKAIRDKANVADDDKLILATTMEKAGAPLFSGEDELRACMHDYDAAIESRKRRMASAISDDPAAMTLFLESRGLYSPESGKAPSVNTINAMMSFALTVADDNPAAVVLAAACLAIRAEQPDLNIQGVNAIYERMRELKTPRALWCLDTLAEWPGLGAARGKALEEADALRMAGVESEPPSASGKFVKALISMIDDTGSRSLVLFRRERGGDFDALGLMLNDEIGVKDIVTGFGAGEEFKAMFEEMGQGVALADIGIDLARELLADALARHADTGTAPPGVLFALLPFFGDVKIVPRVREPNLGMYKLDKATPTQALAGDDTALLADLPLLSHLTPMPEAAYEFCRKYHKPKRDGSLNPENLDRFIDAVLVPERERLLRRMAVNLEVEALAGRAKRKDNRLVVLLWLGLRENVVPFREHPFVREMAIASSDTVIEDIRRGYTTRKAAFDAELSIPPPFADLMGDFMKAAEMGEISLDDEEKLVNDMTELLTTMKNGVKKPGNSKGKGRAKKGKKKA